MRFILLIAIFCFSQNSVYGQSSNCNPTTKSEATLFPNKLDTTYACPIGHCCYTQIKAKDTQLEIISFKLFADKICSAETENTETYNIGNRFSPATMSLLIKACSDTELTFFCIKAKNKQGQILILQPVTMSLK